MQCRCILSLKPKCPIFSHMSWTGKGRDTKTSILWNMDIDTVKASSFGTKMVIVQSTLNKVPIFHSPLCIDIEIFLYLFLLVHKAIYISCLYVSFILKWFPFLFSFLKLSKQHCNSVQGRTGFMQGNPCNQNKILVMKTGFPVMRTGFSLWEFGFRKILFSIQGMGLQWTLLVF